MDCFSSRVRPVDPSIGMDDWNDKQCEREWNFTPNREVEEDRRGRMEGDATPGYGVEERRVGTARLEEKEGGRLLECGRGRRFSVERTERGRLPHRVVGTSS